MQALLFFGVGILTGGLGTLVGAGGAFLLTPLFMFLFPHWTPARLTAISLLAVAANSTSGTLGYAFRRQVHWPSTLLFSLAGIPGVYLGVRLTQIVDRNLFQLIFAIFLLAMSSFVFWRSFKTQQAHHLHAHFWNRRTQVVGTFISFFIGILSSLLGIGGGIIHVPLLSEFLQYPLHLAAGTSHSILAITSTIAVIEHYQSGDLNDLESFVPFLIGGIIIGAQLGAAYSKRIDRHWILRTLGLALFIVSIRLLSKGWG